MIACPIINGVLVFQFYNVLSWARGLQSIHKSVATKHSGLTSLADIRSMKEEDAAVEDQASASTLFFFYKNKVYKNVKA